MLAYVLDENYETKAIFDTFETFIWTERFNAYGDFELVMPVEISALSELKLDRYLWKKGTKTLMIIEIVEITTDSESGHQLKVSGRSLESILYRRIVWNQTILSGNFQNGIKKLLTENIISPTDSSRKIPNFTFKESTDERITKLTFEDEIQLFGEELYTAIESLCQEKDVGFRIYPTDNGFEFELYAGTDRSYDQEKNPWVVFSPSYDNLYGSNYIHSNLNFKTIALVGGEGEGSEKKTATAIDTDGAGAGLSRREMYVNAQTISSNIPEGYEITPDSYLEQIQYQGRLALRKTKITTAFEGDINATIQYIYGQDFELGDIVQIQNEYGIEARSRVSEIVQSQDLSGELMTPTFISVGKTEEN